MERENVVLWDLWKGFFGKKDDVEITATIAKDRPVLTLSLREKESGRRAQLQIPPAEVPEAIPQLRKLSVIKSPQLEAVEIHRRPLTPEVEADYDEQDRLVLRPIWSNETSRFAAADVHKGTIRNTRWFWSGAGFYRVGIPSKPLARFFDPGSKLIYADDEIPDFLYKEYEELAPHLAFKPSARVKASRIARPSIGSMRIKVGTGDWFDVDLKFTAGEHALALAEILKAQGKAKYVRKGDTFVPIEDALKDAPIEIRDGRPQISSEQARKIRSAPFRVEMDKLMDLKPGPEPKGLRTTLRNYQRYGYDWLWWLRRSNFGGILADDMGLGKTHQAMAVLTAAYENGATRPSLVVAPASVVDQWQRKIKEHAPLLMPYMHHGGTRLESVEEFKPLRVVLTTFGLLVRDIEMLAQVDWEYVILDEAHVIKTATTRTSRAAKQLRAAHRLALTGTPIENRPAELWSIFDFAMPGYLGSFERFKEQYEIPIVKNRDVKALEKLRDKIEPFKLRRLKEDVLDELPPKQEDKIYVEMTAQQEALYKAVCEKRSAQLIRELSDEAKPVDYIHVFATLTRLKQICDHPGLVLENGGETLESGKFEAFKELIAQCMDCDQKVVVFSQYVEMLKLIEEHLKTAGVGYSALYGSTRDRGEVVANFNSDPTRRVFVASLLAGGVGIDLQSASVVIHYDRWWNPAKEDQATDRCHRIGQTKNVQVWKLITRRTVEEKIDALISAKAQMFDSIVQAETDLGKTLTRRELIDLLT